MQKGKPEGGFWNCGGQHYADQCPGKGGQMRTLGEFLPTAGSAAEALVSRLCGFKEVKTKKHAEVAITKTQGWQS